jgi:hypothetical protein
MHTVRTIGRVMDNDFQRTGRFDPYMDKLLKVALDSTEADVRGLALEMGTYPDARLEGKSLQQLARLQAKDSDPGVREMAALVMSSGRDTRAVLDAFRESFRRRGCWARRPSRRRGRQRWTRCVNCSRAPSTPRCERPRRRSWARCR